MIRRFTHIVTISVAAVSIGSIVGCGSVSSGAAAPAGSAADWPLDHAQTVRAQQALVTVVTQTGPDGAATDPNGGPSANVTAAWAFGTDRAAANEAMGTSGAAPKQDNRKVACVEARGTFSSATMPRPPGSTAQTFPLVVACFDPDSDEILDIGFDDKPVHDSFDSAAPLHIKSSSG